MNSQQNPKIPIKLDNYSKQKLAHAYYALYDALVTECQTQNKTLGQSWVDALKKIHAIVASKRSETDGTVSDYLMNFFMSHRKQQITKSVTDKDRLSTITTSEENVAAAAARVESEIQNFDAAIKSITDGEVLIVLNPVKPPVGKNFYDWAESQPEGVVVDFNDPRSLEQAYRKYVMRKSK